MSKTIAPTRSLKIEMRLHTHTRRSKTLNDQHILRASQPTKTRRDEARKHFRLFILCRQATPALTRPML